MSLDAARSFLLGAYHDLPNVLFMGSLVLGSITGYLPLVWVSLGLILNGASVAAAQGIFRLLFPTWNQVSIPAGMGTCTIIHPGMPGTSEDVLTVAPSHWLAATVFFAVFSIFNSIQVAMRPAKAGVDGGKINTRRAVSMSAMIIGIVFLVMILGRGLSGCETWLGGALGTVMGGGIAIGYWYLLDACGAGTIPDILQIVGGTAPASSDSPVVCS
jgi:hypothetical protein